MKMTPTFGALPLAMAVVTGVSALFAGCGTDEKSASSPTQESTASAATATAAYEEDMDGVIKQLLWEYFVAKDVEIDRMIYYTDSSGREWIRFDPRFTPEDVATPTYGSMRPAYGFMREVSSGNWELVGLGKGDIQCGVPADVQTGLGFAVCSASEEELRNAIKDFVLGDSARTITDVMIYWRAYYADSSGANWAAFEVLPIPHITDPGVGFMIEVPGGNWEGVAGPGTGPVECSLPADVQKALAGHMCSPQEEEMDEAIKDFVRRTSPPDIENVIVDKKNYATDSSGTTWLECGALLVREGATDQVYGLMKKTPEGNWEGVAGPTASETVWCDIPADVRPFLGISAAAPCSPEPPTPIAE